MSTARLIYYLAHGATTDGIEFQLSANKEHQVLNVPSGRGKQVHQHWPSHFPYTAFQKENTAELTD